MRYSCAHDPGLISELNSGTVIGITSGYDFCAEHEFGIKGINDAFEIPNEEKSGIDRWRINSRNTSNMLILEKKEDFYCLYFNKRAGDRKDLNCRMELDRANIIRRWLIKQEIGLSSAWDDSSFIFVDGTDAGKTFLESLYNAFLENDVAIRYYKLSPDNPFSNPSIQMAIISRMSEKEDITIK